MAPFALKAQMVDITAVTPDSNYCGAQMGITVSGFLSYSNTFTFEGDTSWVSGDTLYVVIEYSWWTGLGFPLLQSFSYSYTFPSMPSGPYWVNATTIYNNNLSDDSLGQFINGGGVDVNIDISDKNPCLGDSVTFENLAPATSKYWYRNGVIVDSSNSYSIVENTAGNYDVTLHVSDGVCFDSSEARARYHNYPEIDLGNDTTLCDDDTLVLNVYDPQVGSYLWENGSTHFMREITAPGGTYSLRVTNQYCASTDSIDVSFIDCYVGLDEKKIDQIQVFYSTEGLLKIRNSGEYRLNQAVALDLKGRVKRDWNLRGEGNFFDLDVSDFENGLYILMLYDTENASTFKFIKY